jgi:hypothetical protein
MVVNEQRGVSTRSHGGPLAQLVERATVKCPIVSVRIKQVSQGRWFDPSMVRSFCLTHIHSSDHSFICSVFVGRILQTQFEYITQTQFEYITTPQPSLQSRRYHTAIYYSTCMAPTTHQPVRTMADTTTGTP